MNDKGRYHSKIDSKMKSSVAAYVTQQHIRKKRDGVILMIQMGSNA